jgi:peptidoglycan/xylan/chitin deacetylase (PgdA/CDA1 family)
MNKKSGAKFRGTFFVSIFSLLAALVMFVSAGAAFAATLDVHLGNRETASDPEVERSAPILTGVGSVLKSAEDLGGILKPQSVAAPQTTAVTPAATLNSNLITNPSLEVAGAGGVPQGWHKGGYGNNTRTLTYPVTGSGGTGTKAIGITVSNYQSGDAKWYPDDVPVTPGKTYQFSDSVKSTAPSIIDIRFKLSNGSYSYHDIANVPAASAYTSVTASFIAPANAVSATVFHLLTQNGTLATDDYSLREVNETATGGNYIQNGDLEVSSNGIPTGWIKGGYGNSTRTFTYPVTGESGKAAKVTISNYVNGDAKWTTNDVPLAAGSYQYTDSYIGTVPSILTVEFKLSNGNSAYTDLGTLPASSAWAHSKVYFTMPAGAVAARIFHLIKQNGSLTIDNASIVDAPNSSGGIFKTGAVSFRFDDGLKNQYASAAPILDQLGFKGTFYIITHQTYMNGYYPGYMSIPEIQSLAARGHEIGAHTETHPHLTTLTPEEEREEIAGSRQDVLSWNVGPVLSFSYPYGEYNADTIQMVKDAGFQSAVATISGYVTQNSDPYQLEYGEVRTDTSLATIQGWIDTAAKNHSWLILTFHGIDTSGDLYTCSPDKLKDIANYVKQSGLPVVTISEGMKSM